MESNKQRVIHLTWPHASAVCKFRVVLHLLGYVYHVVNLSQGATWLKHGGCVTTSSLQAWLLADINCTCMRHHAKDSQGVPALFGINASKTDLAHKSCNL